MNDDKYATGTANISEIHSDLGRSVMANLKEIAPDLARYITEFFYGEICTRPGLDMRSREIATLASLITLGVAPLQLRAHVYAALNCGCTREEIMEIVLQMSVYAGVPAAMNAMFIVGEAFQDLDKREAQKKSDGD